MTNHAVVNESRRRFLKVSAATGGGLLIGFTWPTLAPEAEAAAGEFRPNAWIRIDAEDHVTLQVASSEMGQGVYTAIPMLLAEELDCDWKQVQVEMAPADKAYHNPIFGQQSTGGSTAIRGFYLPLRQAGAAGRAALTWHAAAGMTLAAVMIARMIWRIVNRTPMMPAATPDWERKAAHLVHIALYAVTFTVALTGWLSTAAVHPTVPSSLFWLVPLPAPAFDGGKLVREVHELVADMLVALAAAHALAALWHHYVKKDSVMRRMLMRGQVRRR